MLKGGFSGVLIDYSGELNTHSGKSAKSVHLQPGMGVHLESE